MKINRFSLLGFALILQMIGVNTNASEISGIKPISSGNSNIYNITPEFTNNLNTTGFRKYEKFNLTKGDNANFIMNNLSQFVNLVDSKVSINGLVNTVNSDFSKSNGGLVFVTPDGFVVGANGVLNVGSLSVYTPTQEGYNALSNQLSGAIAGTNQTVNFDPSTLSIGSRIITINGKIVSNGNINFNANSIKIGKDGRVISGLSADNTFISYDKETGNIEITDAENLFNTLVNSGINNNSTTITYNTNGGDIELGGLSENKNGNINLNLQGGNVINTGISDTLLKSSGDINITAQGGSVGENTSSHEDFSKSVNLQASGKVNIYADNIVNVASLNQDLYVDNITGNTVYLTVDKTNETNANPNLYSANSTSPNVVGNKISISTAGNIGSSNARLNISSNSDSQVFDDNAWNNNKFSYAPKGDGLEVVSKNGNIRLIDNDTSVNFQNLSAENGKVDAQFKGNTYIENLSGANVNVLTQGEVLYIDNFQSDTILDDTTNKFTALGLSTDKTKLSDSTIIIKNGIVGTNEKAPILAFSADNIYADGKHFVMGKDRSNTPLENTNGEQIYYVGNARVEEDANTAKISVIGENSVKITANAVTEADVQKAENADGLTRIYYQTSDGIDEIAYTINSENNDSNITLLDGDEPEFGGDTDDDGDIDNPDIGDTDTDPDIGGGDTDNDSDNDTKEPDLGDSDSDDDPDIPTGDTDSDDDIDPPNPGGDTDDDDDSGIPPTPSEPDTGDSDSDDDPDIPTGDTDSDDDIDPPTPGGDTDDDDDSDIPPTPGEPDTGDTDSDDDPDIPTGDTDSDDDIDPPTPGGDTDDDDDSDIPPTPGEPDTGDSDSDDDTDIPTGDTDSDDDIDPPNPGGDTDDDDDSDIPPTPGEPDTGDTDTDDDSDNKPPHGDTDDDSDSDLPPINPKPPVTPDMSDIQPIINNNTEPPKPLHLVTEVLVIPTDDENDYSVERAVNTNGLFGDNEQRADQILAPIRRDAAKKRKFDFRWGFK